MVPVGTELLAQCTVGRRGNLRYGKQKWPQRRDELRSLAKLMHAEDVRSYLEIGLHCGFTFRYLGGLLPMGARLVGVDILKERQPDLRTTQRAMLDLCYDSHIIFGNSREPDIIELVQALGPYDFVLIDGDHTELGVRSDWENYGQLGRIVAFHDIDAERHQHRDPAQSGNFRVQNLWAALKPSFRHREIIGSIPGAGFGVIWTS